MGHDIIAKTENGKEISYLRRNMWSKSIHAFYILLKSGICDGGVSGNGSVRTIKLTILKDTLSKINLTFIEEDDIEDYSKFITDCIKYCERNNKQGVKIHFS